MKLAAALWLVQLPLLAGDRAAQPQDFAPCTVVVRVVAVGPPLDGTGGIVVELEPAQCRPAAYSSGSANGSIGPAEARSSTTTPSGANAA